MTADCLSDTTLKVKINKFHSFSHNYGQVMPSLEKPVIHTIEGMKTLVIIKAIGYNIKQLLRN